MIGKEEVGKMKAGVFLLNCARGGLYNEDALYDGLKSGKVRFAGIDVFIKEPATDHPLLELVNIVVSPHLGANTFESQYNIGTQAAQQAAEAAKGIAFPHAFNLPIDESKIRSEEHTSELQSPDQLVCRLLLEKKKLDQVLTINNT